MNRFFLLTSLCVLGVSSAAMAADSPDADGSPVPSNAAAAAPGQAPAEPAATPATSATIPAADTKKAGDAIDDSMNGNAGAMPEAGAAPKNTTNPGEDYTPIRLELPIKCEVGKDCYLQNYFDTDTGPGYRDYLCGILSYNDNRGTSFRLPNMVKVDEGVDIVASADGFVKAFRDGMEDIDMRKLDPTQIRHRECGNGVVITHDNGWETQYCHLKQGSVVVRRGDVVKSGQKIGLLGLSGKTTFPNLHFTVRYRGQEVDPFVVPEGQKGCPSPDQFIKQTLWSDTAIVGLGYQKSALLDMGFSTQRPEANDAREGKFNELSFGTDAPALITWVDIMGVLPGDKLVLELRSPGGGLLKEDTKLIDRPQAQLFYFSGLLKDEYDWRPGPYTASFKLLRAVNGGAETAILQRESVVTLDANLKKNQVSPIEDIMNKDKEKGVTEEGMQEKAKTDKPADAAPELPKTDAPGHDHEKPIEGGPSSDAGMQ